MITETLIYKYKCSKCGSEWFSENRDTNPLCLCCRIEVEVVPEENDKVNNSKEIDLTDIIFQAG